MKLLQNLEISTISRHDISISTHQDGLAGLRSNFWLPGFFNHHSFVSALKQNFARASSCSVDEVVFVFTVLGPEAAVEAGCYGVHGLYLEGARWDAEAGVLEESLPKVPNIFMFDHKYFSLPPPQVQYSLLPTVQLRPRRVGPGEEETEHPGYRCPVYVTQVSRGACSTCPDINLVTCH